jgi:hypothetical protein
MSHVIVSKLAKKYGRPTTRKYKLITILAIVLVISAITTYYVESRIFATTATGALVFSLALNILNIVAGPPSTRGLVIMFLFLGILFGSIAALVA